jgi:HEAT repeat protein
VAGLEIAKYKGSRKAAIALLNIAFRLKNPRIKSEFISYAVQVECEFIAVKLHKFFKHEEMSVAKTAIEGCAKLKSKRSVEPLIKLLQYLETLTMPSTVSSMAEQIARRKQAEKAQRLIPVVQNALKTITGENKPNAKDWMKWWKRNKKRLFQKKNKNERKKNKKN